MKLTTACLEMTATLTLSESELKMLRNLADFRGGAAKMIYNLTKEFSVEKWTELLISLQAATANMQDRMAATRHVFVEGYTPLVTGKPSYTQEIRAATHDSYNEQTCPKCNGTGGDPSFEGKLQPAPPCPTCHGVGRIKVLEL